MRDHLAAYAQLDNRVGFTLAADRDANWNRRAGRDACGRIDALDPAVADRPYGHRLDEDGNVRRAEPGGCGPDVADGRAAVAEQDDPRQMFARQFAPRRVESGFEIGGRTVDARLLGWRRGIRLGQAAQRRRVLDGARGAAERHDARMCRARRRLDL